MKPQHEDVVLSEEGKTIWLMVQYRKALERIRAWDCLNPPDPKLCADHPWLKALVDEALKE